MGDFRPSHVGICVRDLDRSLRFFCDGLGFEAVERYEMDSDGAPGLERSLEVPGSVKIVSQFVQNDTMKIELLHFLEPGVSGTPSAVRNQVGFTHLSFYVDDVDTAAKHLVDCGATVIEETRASPGIDLLFLADPDGVRVELMAVPSGMSPS
jgi:catechol 2,3-dioxygenase-like lactoylglutathione lyase family enzyme